MKIAFVLDRVIVEHVPLGVGYVAAMLKKHGHEVEYILLEPEDECAAKVKESGARIVAYSVTTGMHQRYFDFNRRLKSECPVFSVVGGPHPSFFPGAIEEEGIDAICVGEGEHPMLELVEALESGREPTDIPNIHYKDASGQIHRPAARPFHQDLNDLPFPDLELMEFLPRHKEGGIAYVMAGRGCPHECNFCFNHVAKKNQSGRFVRFREPENVLDEIRAIRERYHVDMVAFQDDTFTMKRKWLLDFLPQYKEAVGLPFQAHARADTIDEEVARAMGDAGCIRIAVGLEAGGDDMRNRILNKRVTTEQILRSAELVRQNGMVLITQNLFGIPDETVGTVWETIELNVKCQAGIVNPNFYQPYPKTHLAEISKERGLYSGTIEDIPETFYTRIILNLDNRDEIEELAKLIYLFVDYPKIFYTSRFVLRLLPVKKVRMFLIAQLHRLDRKLLHTPKRGLGSRWQLPEFR